MAVGHLGTRGVHVLTRAVWACSLSPELVLTRYHPLTAEIVRVTETNTKFA